MNQAPHAYWRSKLNFEDAVDYHYGHFPPKQLDATELIEPVARAAAALARYDQMLRTMPNSDILLAPLHRQEAVISSRMEGTVSTLDEVLIYEADKEDNIDPQSRMYRSEAVEVFLYSSAMRNAHNHLIQGGHLSEWLIRSTHKELLGAGRGAALTPGEYKREQNFLADRTKRKVLFVPIRPENLQDGMQRLVEFMHSDQFQVLILTALAHVEFEALHPFQDGNGRIGRILITLMLWQRGVISAPNFYISEFFEEYRDEYVERMREVSRSSGWMEWTVFFLAALESQATRNLQTAEDISGLYDEMKDRFRETLSSQWSTVALDYIFSRPIFRNNVFIEKSGIPATTARRFTKLLVESGMLKTVEQAAGRRAALYSFEPLLQLVRR
mgnify:CR=1 FL=1|tara:strand:+ start:496 stop:1650 length:1155 start_codon:yes stop_codon:yes gene_type:complete